NAAIPGREVRRLCAIGVPGRRVLEAASERLGLSARAYTRILRVARTIADLARDADITTSHLAAAVQDRGLHRRPAGGAARGLHQRRLALTSTTAGCIRRKFTHAMHQATTARAFLRRLHPWVGKAVHVRWNVRRSIYQSELDALLTALHAEKGRMPHDLSLRVQGLLARLYREWFPRTWRREPTYAEVLEDFRWWLDVAERWGEPPAKPARKRRASAEPVA